MLRRFAVPLSYAAAAPFLASSFSLRMCSTATTPTGRLPLVEVLDSPLDGVKVIGLRNDPVNTLSIELLEDLLSALQALATPTANETGDTAATDAEKMTVFPCTGVILTSTLSSSTTFSSGLDLAVLNREPFDDDMFAKFWGLFQQLFVTLHTYPVPIVAAVNGHAPAAGCIMAAACDYRVMCKYTGQPSNNNNAEQKKRTLARIGITAVKAGFSPPPYVLQNLCTLVGRRQGEQMITTGAMLTAEEALQAGLVDEVVEEPEETTVAALMEIERLLRVTHSSSLASRAAGEAGDASSSSNTALNTSYTYWIIKSFMRKPLVQALFSAEGRAYDRDAFRSMIQSPAVKANLKAYVASLGGGNKKK